MNTVGGRASTCSDPGRIRSDAATTGRSRRSARCWPRRRGEAVARVEAIDFLNLDGNFSTEGALLDSELYLPKVTGRRVRPVVERLVTVGGRPTKMKALWPFFDACRIVCELDGGNTLLFRKR